MHQASKCKDDDTSLSVPLLSCCRAFGPFQRAGPGLTAAPSQVTLTSIDQFWGMVSLPAPMEKLTVEVDCSRDLISCDQHRRRSSPKIQKKVH